MMHSLYPNILKDICIQASDTSEIPWNFVLSGSQHLKIFFGLLENVKYVELEHDGLRAVFDWGTYFFRFDDEKFSTNICLKLLSYAPEIKVATELESRHIKLLDKWTNYDRLVKASIGHIENGQGLLEPTMSHIFKLPIKHLSAYASCLIPFISTMDDKEYGSVEIIFENGYFDRLEHMLTTYRFHSKNTALHFTGDYTWYEILYVFTKVVSSDDYKGFVSNIVENLSLRFSGDIEIPEVNELQLDKFFEDLSKCFPNLKNVDCCIDFTNNSESLLTEEDASIDLYARTYKAATKQMDKADIMYHLSLEWIREDHVIDTSEESDHFATLSEALQSTLGFKQIEHSPTEYKYEVEKEVADNKMFKMKVSLVYPNFQDYVIQEDILYDAGLYDGIENLDFGYNADVGFYEEGYEDYGGENYEEDHEGYYDEYGNYFYY